MRRWVPVVAAAALLLTGCTVHDAAQARFRIAASSAMFDAPLGVSITGLRAGAHVTVNASTRDAASHAWTSTATYVADSSGTVDPATIAPIDGSYSGVHDTGLLWSMTTPGASFFDPRTEVMSVHLTASVNDRQVATADLTRQIRADVTSRTTSVAQEGFVGVLFTPRDTGTRRPALLAFGGSDGGALTGIEIARAAAAKGYPALGIGYFKFPGLPDTLANIPLEYFAVALRWLAKQPGVDPRRIDVYGLSRGSEAALLLGVHYPDLVFGVVAASPSAVVNPGYPDATKPAWTLHGQPVPAVDVSDYGDPHPADNPSAIIPVERITGPVLTVCGEADRIWPSCAYSEALNDRLGTHPHTERREPGAGHEVGVVLPDVPSTPDARAGGDQQADALGRLDAWTALLDFLSSQTT
jgi:dienelactone hydrolase